MFRFPLRQPCHRSRQSRQLPVRRLLACLVPLWLLSGCAALDEASVARTDRLGDATFYKSYRKGAGDPQPALLLPLAVDAAQTERLQALRAAIDSYLQTQACCDYLADTIATSGMPAVYVGSSEGENAPLEAEDFREEYDKYPPMIVHYQKPDPAWRQQASAAAALRGASRIVVTQLDLVQYPKADRGVFGKKVVLGTHHEDKVRVLSAIDKPVEVLQLSGAVLDADGTELCAGAEGIVGSDAPFWVQVLEAGKDIDDESLERVLTQERREDLPGAPLNWRAAADQLLWNLLRRCS
jgi:hypothetical protein